MGDALNASGGMMMEFAFDMLVLTATAVCGFGLLIGPIRIFWAILRDK